MAGTTPINRPFMPTFNVGSALRSPLDGDDLTNQYKKNQVTKGSAFNLAAQVQQHTVMLNRLRRRIMTPPPEPAPLQQFHPFQIYKPDVKQISQIITNPDGSKTTVSHWMNFEGLGFSFNTDGTLTDGITIDSTMPTSAVDGVYQNLNPITDGWRIWAVRSGIVSLRTDGPPSDIQIFSPGEEAALTMPDFSTGFEVAGCDGYQIGLNGTDLSLPSPGFPYEFNPSQDNGQFGGVIPIILPPTFVNNTSNYIFAIWIQPNNSTPNYPCLNGKAYDLSTVDTSTIFPVPSTSLTIPVGAIASKGYLNQTAGGVPAPLTPYQILYGNETGCKFGFYQNSFIDCPSAPSPNPLVYSATKNFRGSWQNDPITTLYFYVGDVVKYEVNMSIGGTTVYSENQYMCGVAGTTANPSTDTNWTMIAGVRLTSDTSRTPNTH